MPDKEIPCDEVLQSHVVTVLLSICGADALFTVNELIEVSTVLPVTTTPEPDVWTKNPLRKRRKVAPLITTVELLVERS